MEELDIELLISEIENEPVIWDTSLEEYKDRCRKNAAWVQICSNLLSKFEMKSEPQQKLIIQDMMSKWRTVRDNFVRSLKKQAKYSKSGSARKKIKTYIYGDQLSFLKKNKELKNTENSLEENSNELGQNRTEHKNIDDEGAGEANEGEAVIETDDNNTNDTINATPTSSMNNRPIKKRRKKIDIESALMIFMDAHESKKNEPQEDDDIAFLYSLLPTIRSLNMTQKWSFRIQTMQLLQNIKNPPTLPIHPPPFACPSTSNHPNLNSIKTTDQNLRPFLNPPIYPLPKTSSFSGSESRPISTSSDSNSSPISLQERMSN